MFPYLFQCRKVDSRHTSKALEASMKAAYKDSLLSRDSAIASVNNRLAFVSRLISSLGDIFRMHYLTQLE